MRSWAFLCALVRLGLWAVGCFAQTYPLLKAPWALGFGLLHISWAFWGSLLGLHHYLGLKAPSVNTSFLLSRVSPHEWIWNQLIAIVWFSSPCKKIKPNWTKSINLIWGVFPNPSFSHTRNHVSIFCQWLVRFSPCWCWNYFSFKKERKKRGQELNCTFVYSLSREMDAWCPSNSKPFNLYLRELKSWIIWYHYLISEKFNFRKGSSSNSFNLYSARCIMNDHDHGISKISKKRIKRGSFSFNFESQNSLKRKKS